MACTAPHTMSTSSSFVIRRAELRDLPRITAVCLDGLPDDPTFDFLWRYRHQYPDDNYFFWLQSFKADLYNPRKTLLVAEESSQINSKCDDRGEAVATIIAFAVWELNGVSTKSSRNFCTPAAFYSEACLDFLHRCITRLENWAVGKEYIRRDGDPNRIAAFTKTMGYVQSKYWEKKYPQNYHLVLLTTHPHYRRRGAGTALSRWGIEQGVAAGFDIGVEASPMGYPLYQHLGFVLQEELLVECKNDDATLPVKVMVYDKKKKSLCY